MALSSNLHTGAVSTSSAEISRRSAEENPVSWNLRLGTAVSELASKRQSRGWIFPLDTRPVRRSMSRTPPSISAIPMRTTVPLKSSSTASRRRSISRFSKRGALSMETSFRAPIPVFVLSRSHSREPYFLPSALFFRISRLRTAVASSDMFLLASTSRRRLILLSACFCVSRKYSKSAPTAQTIAGCPSSPSASSEAAFSCSRTARSAAGRKNACGR